MLFGIKHQQSKQLLLTQNLEVSFQRLSERFHVQQVELVIFSVAMPNAWVTWGSLINRLSVIHFSQAKIQRHGYCAFGSVSSIVLLAVSCYSLQICYLFIPELLLCCGSKQLSYSLLEKSGVKYTVSHCHSIFSSHLLCYMRQNFNI